jgi:thioredoxin 1
MIKVKRFTAAWCGPCKVLAPIFAELESDIPGVTFETIDVDQNKEETMKYMVTSVPTVVIEKDGEMVQRYTGVQPKSTYALKIKSLK